MPVVEYITLAESYVTPAPMNEYSVPVSAVNAALAPVVEYVASAPAVHNATSSGGRVKKSARLSPSGPEVFEF